MSEFPPASLSVLANSIVTLLKKRKETLALIETASGGLIGASILSIPGASRVFKGGINAYSLPLRQAFLNWSEDDTKAYAGPTTKIVKNLALSLQSNLPPSTQTTYILSESAVAGPTLPPVYRKEITVGYVPLAIIGLEGKVWFEGEVWIDDAVVGGERGGRGGMMVEIARVGMVQLEKVLLRREDEERGKL